jgi:hypothetical protein
MLALSLRRPAPEANPAVRAGRFRRISVGGLNEKVKRLSKLTEKTRLGLRHVSSVNPWQLTLTTEQNLGL